ncbi:hypothetical protein FH972_011614 [Carpinus fangiana]|uniref:UDP-glycosyltransferases domain-containing protein n=1 Tax=Carpinus fangiana TaxID=176857 RepID=A0A660KYU6_9ROSI|nr:hypothetical protein FH972_011614 [Carpinus fangiana]
MEKRGNIRRLNRVVLVPGPFQGHINPMLQLGTILHSKGFSITVVHTQYNSPKPSSHPDFSFLPLPDTSSSATTIDEMRHFALQLNTDCKARFQECLAEVMRQLGPYDGIACIIYDQLMYFSEAAAKDLKLPCIILRTGSAAIALARDALLQLKAEGQIPFPESRSNDQILELYPLRFKDLPIPKKLENFLQLLSKTNNIRTSSAIIYDTVDCLENSLLAKIQEQCQVRTLCAQMQVFEREKKKMEKERKRCLRPVVLVPAPFQGHINPMLQLGSILHSNGFSITVVHAQYNSPDPSTHPDFSFIPLPDSSSDHNILAADGVAFVLELNAKCKARFLECLTQVMRQLGSDDSTSLKKRQRILSFQALSYAQLVLPIFLLVTPFSN